MKILSYYLCAITMLVAGVGASHGQSKTDKATIDWSENVAMRKRSMMEGFIGADEQHYYMLVNERGDHKVMKFTHDLQLVHSAVIPRTYNKNYHYFQFVIFHGGKLMSFTSRFINKEKRLYLYMEELDLNTLEGNGDLKEVVIVEDCRRWNSSAFSNSLSINEKKLLLEYTLPYEYNMKEKIGVIVYDENMDEMWKKELELPYLSQLYTAELLKVDNDGDLYVLGLEYKEPRERKTAKRQGVPSYGYHVLSYQNKGAKLFEFDLDGGDKFITDLSMVIDDNKQLVCAGLYSDKGSWSAKGSIFLRVDCKTGSVLKSSFKEFTMEFITAGLTDRQAARAEKKKEKKGIEPELYRYDLKELIVRGDGGCVLLAEQYYVVVTTSRVPDGTGGFNTQTTYTYYYNDVIAVNIDPQGEIQWHARIPKQQISRNDQGRYSSYAMAVVKDRIFFIFNDDPRNLSIPEGDRPYSADFGKTAVVTLVQLTADGKTTREALHYNEGERIYTVPKLSEQIAVNAMILFATGRKIVRFAKVNFN